MSLQDRLGLTHPIIQAPMAGSNDAALAVAVSEAGGLGSLPAALFSPDQLRGQLEIIRQQTARPVNINFFVHTPPTPDPARETAWRRRLQSQYDRLGLPPDTPAGSSARAPFDAATCELVEHFEPAVVSFHFGLPHADLMARVKATGALVLSSATTVEEARWLEARGADAIIAQGAEAGGHRGIFLSDDIIADVSQQVGTMALVPQIVDAVRVPVIAAGGIADARGVAAAFALGAELAQVGTAYLFCPEAKPSPVHRKALDAARDGDTTLTNVFTGRPARGVVNTIMRDLGPLTREAPAFPLAGGALAPLKSAAEARGDGGYSSLWSGQAAALAPRGLSAADLTKRLAAGAPSARRTLT